MLGQGLPILISIVKHSKNRNLYLPDMEIVTYKQSYVQSGLMVHNLDSLIMKTDHKPTHPPYLGCEIYRTKPHRTMLYPKLEAVEMPLDS